jgi:Histidinol-phosphate/aromatic aminotransferase and cobyric acid decarboxylase
MYEHGGQIYEWEYKVDFSTNINPFGMPESVKKAAKLGIEKGHLYPDVKMRKLKKAIAQAERVEENQIICGNGAADLIYSLVLAKKPKKALLLAPSFFEYESALKTVACEISYYYLKEENSYNLLEEYIQMLDYNWDMVVLCNPNNPTGSIIDKQLIMKIAEKCLEKNIILLIDECFADFIKEPVSISFTHKELGLSENRNCLCQFPNVFILKAFTKMYAMAGLRLGYGLSGNKALLQDMEHVTQPWNVSVPAEMAGIAALKETEFVEKTRRLIARERAYLHEEMAKLPLQLYDAKANYILFKIKVEIPLREVCQKAGILIRDCSNYQGLEKGYYRIAIKTREENELLIEVLTQIMGAK